MIPSCAQQKKQVSAGEVQPTEEEATAPEAEKAEPSPAVEPAKEPTAVEKEPTREEGETPTTTTTPSAAESEQERQKRLMEIQRAEMIKNEILRFESENVYFDFDKSILKPAAKAVLKKKAEWLKEYREYSLRIEGHCDERGTNEYNLALGERRAHSAKRYLTALGINSSRITTISYGEARPADPRPNEEAWAKNRRDEFTLIK
jgi:peptidoglycan-associated lipoprotein